MTPTQLDYPVDRHGLIRRDLTVEAGFSDHDLAHSVKTKQLIRLTSGVYRARIEVDPEDRTAVAEAKIEAFRLKSLAIATGRNHGGNTALSHTSAAIVHGLPLLKPELEMVHLTNGEIGGGRARTNSLLHASDLPPGDVVEVNGVWITSLARTAADVAQLAPAHDPLAFSQAMTVFDAALRAGVDRDELAAQLDRRRRRGTRVAKAALPWADGRAESVGESWGRAQMIQRGLPAPELQVEYHVGGETHRVDGDWERKLVWEFDGRGKYQRYLADGETPADAYWREKKREDALRSLGVFVVRTYWDLMERGRAVDPIERALFHLGLC